MPVFSSDRERRLWRWTLYAVLGIYSTLAFASTLAEYLYNQGLAAIAFLVCMLLVAVAILTQGIKTRPGGVEIGVGLGLAVVYFLVLFRLTLPERSHLIEYGVVAILAYEALAERARQGRRIPLPAILAIIFTSTVGTMDELIQYALPNRHFEWDDILFNILASVMAVTAMVVLRWARTVHERRRSSRI